FDSTQNTRHHGFRSTRNCNFQAEKVRRRWSLLCRTERVLPARIGRGGLLRRRSARYPTVTDIIIRATHTQEVLGEQGRRIRELTSLIQKRFKFPENSVSLYAAKVQNRGLSAVAQCESLRYKLLNGLAVRRACYGVLRFIMESGAKGCEVVVSGKLRAARAKSMKFTDGFMIHSGQPAKDFIDSATRHVLLRQGVLGIKVKIMRGSDPEGKSGPQKSLPDSVTIIEPKEETSVVQPHSEDYGQKKAQAEAAAAAARESELGEGEGAPAEEQ
ncbi:40S ribosomal protein S3, partial [Lachnellula arida]